MILYRNRNKKIKIRIVEERDIPYILKYFKENDFNCDYGTGALRPSNYEFEEIIREVINKKDRTQTVLVIEKDGECIGYLACHVSYDRMRLGHMAIKKEERNNGYGKLLITVALKIASNENRDVSLTCYYGNKSYWKILEFDTTDNVHYYCDVKKERNSYPTIFMTCEEFKQMREIEAQEELEEWGNFLGSGPMKYINRKR